jgi:hypothetical protein
METTHLRPTGAYSCTWTIPNAGVDMPAALWRRDDDDDDDLPAVRQKDLVERLRELLVV